MFFYCSPSLIDHSCEPNAVVTFTGKTLFLRALEEIKDPNPENVSFYTLSGDNYVLSVCLFVCSLP